MAPQVAILLPSELLVQLLRAGDLHLETVRAADVASQRQLKRALTEAVSHNRRNTLA